MSYRDIWTQPDVKILRNGTPGINCWRFNLEHELILGGHGVKCKNWDCIRTWVDSLILILFFHFFSSFVYPFNEHILPDMSHHLCLRNKVRGRSGDWRNYLLIGTQESMQDCWWCEAMADYVPRQHTKLDYPAYLVDSLRTACLHFLCLLLPRWCLIVYRSHPVSA